APKGGKLSTRLRALSGASLQSAPESAQAAAVSLPKSGPGSLVRHAGGRLVVQVRMSDLSNASIARLATHGARLISSSPSYITVTVDGPPGALRTIANDPAVSYVSEVLAPTRPASALGATNRRAAATAAVCAPTISEGDSLMNAATARAARAVDGSGETVG